MKDLKRCSLSFLPLYVLSLFLHCTVEASPPNAEPFPLYPTLEKNVAFWTKVYTEYPSTYGFLHDSEDLSVIYAVLRLRDGKEKGARRTNKKIVDRAKKRYARILKKLASGQPPTDGEERRVLDLWGGRKNLKTLKNAAGNLRFQHCIRERFLEGFERSGRHLATMRRIFREAGLPEDLIYLPHVESSFDYNAYSKFGAAGIWQFIRSTGRRFLRIDYVVDERRDPLLATRAAAKYLQENYEKLKSWPLAITAYNHGANGMLKAQEQCGGFEEILCSYESRSFGFASRNFYAQFLAARAIAKNPSAYFKELHSEPPLQSVVVPLQGYAALQELVDYFGVSLERIKELNPALRPPVLRGDKYVPKGYDLRLPSAEGIKGKIAALPADLFKKEQKRSRFYRVQRGDTAGLIARRHKVTLGALVAANHLGRRARIYIGQNLVIPGVVASTPQQHLLAVGAKTRPKGYTPSPTLALVSEDQLHKTTKTSPVPAVDKAAVVTKKTVAVTQKQPQEKSGSEAAKAQQPKAVLGDASLPEESEESEESAVTGPEAAELTQADATVLLGDFQVEKFVTLRGSKVGSIRVEAWETLGHYAEWLNVPTRELRRLNSLKFKQPILTGQTIRVPLEKVSADLFEERRYEFHKGLEEDFFSNYHVVETKKYVVQKGDTVWKLCHEELDLPFWLLRKYNSGLPFSSLKTNQILIIPIVEKIS